MKKALYVRGFPSTYTKADLSAAFREFGRLKKVEIISKEEKLFGIIKYYEENNVDKAIEAFHMKEIDGINWFAAICVDSHDWSIKSQKKYHKKEIAKRTIFIRNFDESFNEEEAAKLFSKFGEISQITLKKSAGFITFTDNLGVNKALERRKFLFFNGKRIFANLLIHKERLNRCIHFKKERKIQKRLELIRRKRETENERNQTYY